MLAEKIDQLVEDEVNIRVESVRKELEIERKKVHKLQFQVEELTGKLNLVHSIHSNSEQLETLKQTINAENIKSIVALLNFKKEEIIINGSRINELPVWFELTLTYYPDKEKLWNLFDFFGIKYASWLRQFCLPQDYNEDELLAFMKVVDKHGITNGCNFSQNIGYYYESLQSSKGLAKYLINGSTFSNYIPWQLLLKNPLLTKEDIFKEIIKIITTKKLNSEYFFRIQDYQSLTELQVKTLFESIGPDSRQSDEHVAFIRNNQFIIKRNPEISFNYKDKMTAESRSTFYFKNYPTDMQKAFIRECSGALSNKIELIKCMEICKEEKVALIYDITLSDIM